MSNETDLDWLARNVHVWKSGYDLAVVQRGIEEIYVTWPSACSSGITKKEWLSRRAELQNKPSWSKAEQWAEWLAQDSYGCWGFFQKKPLMHALSWIARSGYYQIHSPGNLLLGDWRDTLEKRPEQDEFEPFVSVEDSKEQDMKQDNGWFERGELPPVGKVCLYVVSDRLSAEVEITAHAKFGLCFVEVGKSGENYVSKTAELHRFRPIPTERDVLIEIIKNTDDTDDKIADAILAAGFSLRGK